jgi:hypothetical protein
VSLNQFGLLLVVTLIESFIGGIFGDRLLAPSLATEEKAKS